MNAFRIHKIVLVLIAVAASGALQRPVASQSSQAPPWAGQAPPRPTPSRPNVPAFVQDFPSAIRVTGNGTGPTETAARNGARRNAGFRAVAELARRLFSLRTGDLPYSSDDAIDYVLRVGSPVREEAPRGRAGYDATVTWELNKVFLDPARVRALMRPTLPPKGSTAWGHLLIAGRREWPRTSAAVPVSLNYRVQVRARDTGDGNFFFLCSLRDPVSETAILRFETIVVEEDGSTGNTTWSFDVFINGAKVRSIPPAPYNDDVGSYSLRSAPLQFPIPSSDGLVELKIQGTRPPQK